ncbi:alcohol dehydrogenase catalytic domain-containing protein [Thermogemmatispora sp.]|uniref:alcohol dehydrogenase catalytic domain-containing protein n=1 Tax=Thermogemmatispora sp. TaxID=1968838 RepID=UPI0035E412A7
MKAARYYGRGDVRIEEVPAPGEPGEGEVLLQVLRAGICGTDVAEFLHGPHFVPLQEPHPFSGHRGPLILGHEFMGRLVACGPGVEGLTPGQRVAVGAGMWCGECRWCQAGRTNLCARYYTLGLQADGGLAELARVPARMCYPVPEDCSDEAAALAQPLAIALHALRRSRARRGETIALIGVGGIGAFLLAAARALEPSLLIAVDVDERRLARAAALGASHLVRAGSEDVLRELRRLTDGEGPDLVIEASGAPSAPALALAAAQRGGRLLLVGLQAEPRALDLHTAVIREVEILTTNAHVCPIDLPEALALLRQSELAAQVIERVIPLERLVPDGLLAMAEGRAYGKILLDPQAEARAG